MRGTNFFILWESPVDVLSCLTQNARTGVLAKENFAHTITSVNVPLQSRDHSELRGHPAEICRLLCRLCCGNKAIGVDLKLKAQVNVLGDKKTLDDCNTTWLFKK